MEHLYKQPRILIHNADYFGGGFYRAVAPAHTVSNAGEAHVLVHQMTYDEESIKALAPDAIVFQHPTSDDELTRLRMYRKALPRTTFIYELDDAFWDVPKESHHYSLLPPDIKARILNGANLCDAAIVTTQPLADLLRKESKIKDIRVVPNYIPRSILENMKSVRRDNFNKEKPKPRVGWAGGIGHSGDINFLKDVVLATKDEVQWVFFGLLPDGIDPTLVELHDGVPIGQYHAKLAALDLDLALAPLADNTFNNCKSNLRILEYGAAGFAVLASRSTAYADFPHVNFADFTAEDFTKQIRVLLQDRDSLYEQAELLNQHVRDHWCLENHVSDFAAAWLKKSSKWHKPVIRDDADADWKVVSSYDEFRRSVEENPSFSLLWLEPNTHLTDEDINRMHEKINMGIASVSALSNDGLYPLLGQCASLADGVVEGIRKAAAQAGNPETISLPYALGPAVLFSAKALTRIGAPDFHRFGDRGIAILDWCARASLLGFMNLLDTQVYAHVSAAPAPKQVEQNASVAAQGWSPAFAQTLNQSKYQEDLEFVCQNIELKFVAENFKHPMTSGSYNDWFKVFNSLTPHQRQKAVMDMDKWANKPLISLITPVFNPDIEHLRAVIVSVKNQIYPHWELLMVDDCSTNPAIWMEMQRAAESDSRIKIKRREKNGHICAASNDAIELASGEWMVCLDHDDTIEPHALYALVYEINKNPDAAFFYSDCDKIDVKGNFVDPYFTPDFDYDLFLAQNYVTHLSAYRMADVRAVEGYREGYEGSQDWDLSLRYLTHTCGFPFDRTKIVHIPHVLYHWRQSEQSASANVNAKPYALVNGRKAILNHLKATGQLASVMPHPITSFTMVRPMLPDPLPKVSVIIQTKDNPTQLARCLDSLVEKTAYPDYEIIVLDNGWKKTALSETKHKDRVNLIANPGKFNYAAANNKGAELAAGEILIFLNDDTEIIEPAWMIDLAATAARSWTGCAGPRLIYGSGEVQQAGILIDMKQPAGFKAIHAFQRTHLRHTDPAGRAVLMSERSAITGACMAVRKSIYQEVGGMDAENFPRDYNDVDFCLRLLEKGYYNTFLGHILVIHHEGQTKSRNPHEHTRSALADDDAKLGERHGAFVDRYINPNNGFTPNMDTVNSEKPQFEWIEDREEERVLVLNGNHAESVEFYQEGVLAFGAALDGHALTLAYPRMSRVASLDTRTPPADLMFICAQLGIGKIVLNGIGDGTYGILGYLEQMEKEGFEIEYNYMPNAQEEQRPDAVKAYLWAKAKKMDADAAAQS